MVDPDPATRGPAGSGPGLPFAQLIQRNLPALIGFLRHRQGARLAQVEAPEDLAQSVCREVLDDLPVLHFAREEEFRAYLFLQARRKLLDRARYYQLHTRDPELQQELSQSAACESLASPSRVAAGKEEWELAQAAIAELPEAQREVVLLSRIVGLTYAEIAATKQVSEASVRALVARGLARLSGIAKRRGLAEPPTATGPDPAPPTP